MSKRSFHISNILSPSNTLLRFLITDCPDTASLPDYLNSLAFAKPKYIFRICNKNTYDPTYIEAQGIVVDDSIKFNDGGVPTTQQVNDWLSFLESQILKAHESNETPECIVVHCASGIGRAPLLVSLAYIESNIEPMDAIEVVRHYRRGALNTFQINWLCEYSGKRRLILSNVLKKKKKVHSKSKVSEFLDSFLQCLLPRRAQSA